MFLIIILLIIVWLLFQRMVYLAANRKYVQNDALIYFIGSCIVISMLSGMYEEYQISSIIGIILASVSALISLFFMVFTLKSNGWIPTHQEKPAKTASGVRLVIIRPRKAL